uniref:hypothetical protein n=1 Tax=Aeromonas allosaccharophila TaxID=656 RepID=UPI002B485A19
EPAGMTTIGLSYSLVKISTKCAPALTVTGSRPTETFSSYILILIEKHDHPAPLQRTRRQRVLKRRVQFAHPVGLLLMMYLIGIYLTAEWQSILNNRFIQ